MEKNITAFRICTVRSVIDDQDGQRIKAEVLPEDRGKTISEIPYAFPLLPKTMHVVPKVDEAVLIICADLNNPQSQRYYIGPIISQPQSMDNDNSKLGATTLLNGSVGKAKVAPSKLAESDGTLPKIEDVALIGRGKSDIILTDNDARIRCGAKIKDEGDPNKIIFNKRNPSYIKLKSHDKPLIDETTSTISIVGQNVNILSPSSKQSFELTDNKDLITDDEMNKILSEAHVLPYGDVLVDFLKKFLLAFKAHTHAFHGLPPVQDETYIQATGYDMDSMLSKNIRIN